MISLREARTDADLEAWIGVRRALLPNESGGTVELLRAQKRPERLLLLAELDGRLAGTGLADRSDVGDRFAVKPRVLPWARRQGVGGALLHALAAHVERFGLDAVTTHLEEPEARGFAERFGFREIDRQVEQVKTLGREEPPPAPPGLELVTIAERPELLRAAYPLACEGYADFALDAPASISLETGSLRRRRSRRGRSSRSRTARSSATAACCATTTRAWPRTVSPSSGATGAAAVSRSR